MASNIQKLIDEMQNYIDTQSKPAPFSSSKIILNRDELEDILNELKETTPDEIRRYQKMLQNRDAILNDAKSKADAIVAQAQIKTDELVSEHQIMQQAYAQANQIVLIATKEAEDILNKANSDANNIRMGAIQYTDDLLNTIQSILSNSIDITRSRNETFLSKMEGILEQVVQNRDDLRPQQVMQETQAQTLAQDEMPTPISAEEAVKEPTDENVEINVPEEFFRKD